MPNRINIDQLNGASRSCGRGETGENKEDNSCFRCSRLESLESYQLNYIQRLFRRLIHWVIFVFCLDAFLVYKQAIDEPGKLKYRQFCLPQLRMDFDEWDRRREKWRRWQLLLLTYLCTRYFSVMFVQFASYKWEKSEKWLGADGTHMAFTVRELLGKTSDLIGNPLRDYSPLTITFYGCLIVALAYSFGQAPHMFITTPPDALQIRLFMEPKREMRRIHFVIEHQLNSLINSIGRFDYRLALLGRRLELNAVRCSQLSRDKWLKHQRRLVESHKAHMDMLRPAAYTLVFYRELYTSIMVSCYSIYLLGNLLMCHLIYSLYSMVLGTRKQGLSWPEWLAMGELSLGIMIATNTILCLLVVFIYNLRTQSVISADVAFNLRALLRRLEVVNQQTRHLLKPTQVERAYRPIEWQLVSSLVNLRQSDDEIRRMCVFLSNMLEVMLTMAALAVLVTIATFTIHGIKVRVLMATVLVPLWLSTNVVLLGSAYIYARVISSEKLSWSILAQLFVKTSRTRRMFQDDVVAANWQRLVHGHEFMDNTKRQNGYTWYSAHPFGMAITFGKVMELNFLIVSASFLVHSFNF